jgi:hypothetical protein
VDGAAVDVQGGQVGEGTTAVVGSTRASNAGRNPRSRAAARPPGPWSWTWRTPAARSGIRDRDGKYPALFDSVLADAAITVVLSGVRMPRMNSIMERRIQACRHGLLDRTLIFNQAHSLHAPRV